MTSNNKRMLDAFAEHERSREPLPTNKRLIGMPVGSRLQRIYRLPDESGWQLWISTRDYVHGTYMILHNDGSAETIVVRADEGDETLFVRPPDESIRSND